MVRALPTSCSAIGSSQLNTFPRYQRQLMLRVVSCRSNEEEKQSFLEERSSSEGEDSSDFWEGEQWERLGQLSSVTIPILVVLGALVGLFAAQTYNQDASVFLDSPKSTEGSARLYTFE